MNRNGIVSVALLAIAAGVFGLGLANGESPFDPSATERPGGWEHQCVGLSFKLDGSKTVKQWSETLNTLGKEGWELTTMYAAYSGASGAPPIACLKRKR